MKTIIASAVLLTTLSLASASIDVNLKYGMRGDHVYELQDFLVDQGLLNTAPTGFFGLLTLKAVKQYQLGHDLPSTGYVGILTRTAINNELAPIIEESIGAEAQEPVFEIPTPVYIPYIPPQVYTPVYTPYVPPYQPVIEPVKIMPTCTLTVNPKSPFPANNHIVILDWTSTNATKGELQYKNTSGQWIWLFNLPNLESGTSPTFTLDLPIRIHVENADGEANCVVE